MLNATAKSYNQMSKKNSQTQKMKGEYAKNHPVNYVECKKCKRHDTTLYKRDGEYYCKQHIPNNF